MGRRVEEIEAAGLKPKWTKTGKLKMQTVKVEVRLVNKHNGAEEVISADWGDVSEEDVATIRERANKIVFMAKRDLVSHLLLGQAED